MKKSVLEIDVTEKRVFVRVDFNVPLGQRGEVVNDTRIRASLPTIRYLTDRRAKVILASHLGRPKGRVDDRYRLDAVAVQLQKLLNKKVIKVNDCIGKEPQEAIAKINYGEVVCLENVRFYPEEEKNDESFARRLAELADIYVNDAFGTAHRAHASTAGVARFLPAVAGILMQKEITVLGEILQNPKRPFFAILGGAKVSDKIGVIDNLLNKVDGFIVGGGMANTFLGARGYQLGKSFLEVEKIPIAKELIKKAEEKGVGFLLPVDLVAAPSPEDTQLRTVTVENVPADWMALDIGPESVKIFKEHIKKARTVFWNGPLGFFEAAPFAKGTFSLAQALAECTAISVVGGGDTVSAVEKAGVSDKITHISTGGGASLEFLEGKSLPGVSVLLDA